MASQLADETLHHILEHALEVSDDDFSDVSGMETSPFARREYSSSDILLVCKRWMRVATPLLYDTVVLRSTAQAQALAKALKKNPEFAPYLKKLRLEGGFGASVGKIMHAATKLSDLHLSLDLTAQDNVKSMCAALPAINPRRLVLSSIPFSASARSLVVIEALRTAAPAWNNLTTAVLHSTSVLYGTLIISLLAGIPSLKNLWLIGYHGNFQKLESRLPDVRPCNIHVEAVDLAALETLERVSLEASKHGHRIISHLKSAPLAVIRTVTVPDSDHWINRINPLQQAPPQVQREIWSLILEQVLATDDVPGFYGRKHECFATSTSTSRGPGPTNIKALYYMSVSKLFLDICTPIAIRHALISYPRTGRGFLRALELKSELALGVRSLLWEPSAFQSELGRCLSRLPELTSLRCWIAPCDLHVFRTFRETLTELDVNILSLSVHSSCDQLLLSFPSLRRLRFEYGGKTPLPPNIFDPSLPRLEELDLPGDNPSWIMDIFPQSRLPQLRALRIPTSNSESAIEDLLRAYGHGCEEVQTRTRHLACCLALCPNARTIVLVGVLEHLPHEAVTRDAPHARLEKIIFTELVGQGYPRKSVKTIADGATAFFAALSPAKFPALREIIVERVSWPTTPREIASEPAVKWAESLHTKGIQLLDETGKAWRPRLKSTGARRG